jgi:tetratricopeptide (TPR) repeat protein
VTWFYLYKALLPVNLAFVYPQWHIETGNPLWWLPLLAAVIVTAVLWQYRESWSRPLLFAWGFFCVALVPVLGLTDVYFMKYSLVADHYQHIAIIGVIALAAAGWNIWYNKTQKQARLIAILIAVSVVGSLAVLTWRQNGIYKDEITLYEATLQKNPECWMACRNLGTALAQAGRLNEALEQYKQALRIKPDYAEVYCDMGIVFGKLGLISEAIINFKRALEINPDYIRAFNNLALAYAQTNQPDKAIAMAEKALEIARSRGQRDLVKKIEDWLKGYKASLAK